MDTEQWRKYYQYMIQRGSMRPEKEQEVVKNCGGLKMKLVKDPADPLKQIEVVEPFEEAVERIRGEILEMTSRESLERKADQIIAEIRRR